MTSLRFSRSLNVFLRKSKAEKFITSCAKLIAPAIETSFAAGFDWYFSFRSVWYYIYFTFVKFLKVILLSLGVLSASNHHHIWNLPTS